MFENGFGGFKFGGFGMGDDDYDEQPRKKKNIENTQLYELLGVDKNATTEEIKKAFKKKAIKEHPDKGGDPQKFKEVTMAKDILCDPDKRQVYDTQGIEGIKEGGGGGGGNPFDVFGNLFGFGGGRGGGDAREKQKKGKPQLKELKVTLEDVYVGKLVKLQHQRKQICTDCDGKGGSSVVSCTKCKGKGIVEKMGPGMYQHVQQHCQDCKGEGKICAEKDKCKTCKGQKVIDQKKVIDVAIEQGVPNEHDYIFNGECDELPGQLGGDLHVRIQITPHKKFERKGADLFYNKDITLLEALTGFNFEIEHLDKLKFTVTTYPSEVIQHGDIKCLKGKGMPFYKDTMSHGNMYIKFNVKFPKKGELKPQQIETLKTILPGPKQKELPQKNVEYLDEYDESELNPNAEGGQSKKKGYYDEDDQQAGGQHQQRVQCQQQ